MRYITKCAKYRGSKVDYVSIIMTVIASRIQLALNASQCRWLVRTGLRTACQTAIKWRIIVVLRVRCRCHGCERNDCQWVNGNEVESSRWERRGWHWRIIQPNLRSGDMSNVVNFTFVAHFWLVICNNDPRSHLASYYLRVLVDVFHLDHLIFRLITAMRLLSSV